MHKATFLDFIAHMSHKVDSLDEALALMDKWYPARAPFRAEDHSRETKWRGCYGILDRDNKRTGLVQGA